MRGQVLKLPLWDLKEHASIIFKHDIVESKAPEKKRAELAEMYRKKFANPYVAVSKGYLDDVIEPEETRERLIAALKAIYRKREERPRRKHGNIPV